MTISRNALLFMIIINVAAACFFWSTYNKNRDRGWHPTGIAILNILFLLKIFHEWS